MEMQRKIWIDNTKVIACMLVLIGHFFQSMVKSEIIIASDSYMWFNETIYMFHVPLFFVCSGFLYQQKKNTNSRINFIVKKLVDLGVPYLAFSIVTWVMKSVLAGEVNRANNSLIYTLFFEPASPYWYLYALFFIFALTPAIRKKAGLNLLLSVSFLLNIVSGYIKTGIYALDIVVLNEFWFVLGMWINQNKVEDIVNKYIDMKKTVVMLMVFIGISIFVYSHSMKFQFVETILGILACISIISMMINIQSNACLRVLKWASKYTMPIFLMHTIFAAGLRIVLIKLQIYSIVVHTCVGIGISILGPVIAYMIMKKSVFLEFFIYPNKVIKKRNVINENING